MEGGEVSDETAWVADEVERAVLETLDTYLRDKSKYEEEKVPQWVNDICEQILQKLIGHKKPFKYVVTCMITQRTGSGLNSATSAYLDTVNDGVVSFLWPKEKSKDPTNKVMWAIVSVFGLEF